MVVVLKIELCPISQRMEPLLIKLVWRFCSGRFVPVKVYILSIQNINYTQHFQSINLSPFCVIKVFRMRTKYTGPASPSPCLSHHTPHSRNIFVAASFPVSLTSSQPREYPEISSMRSWSQWNEMLPDEVGRWESRQCLGVTVCVCCNQSSS